MIPHRFIQLCLRTIAGHFDRIGQPFLLGFKPENFVLIQHLFDFDLIRQFPDLTLYCLDLPFDPLDFRFQPIV